MRERWWEKGMRVWVDEKNRKKKKRKQGRKWGSYRDAMEWREERRGEKRGEKEDEGEITRCEAARVCGGTEKENIKGK